jgi:DNA-binding MarR family transcriptional regulator
LIVKTFGDAVRAYQTVNDNFDQAVADRVGMNRTDARCLDIINRSGSITAGELATQTGLTGGAITTALDRLEAAGYVRRVRDHSDRRRVLVEMTTTARARTHEIYGPIAEEGAGILDNYGDGQLETIRDFMTEGRELLERHAARVREMADSIARAQQHFAE